MSQSFDEIQLVGEKEKKVDLDQFFDENKVPLIGFLVGLILLGLGIFIYKQGSFNQDDKVEIITGSEVTSEVKKEIVVEITGGVEKSGVYKISENSRIEDLLIAAGGLSADADRNWVQKYVNRAAKLVDGQKIYIAKVGEQSGGESANFNGGIKIDQGVSGVSTSGLVNINTSLLSELDQLPGIGQTYGQSIIEHRPYSSVEELLSKGALKQSVYDKVKDKVTVY